VSIYWYLLFALLATGCAFKAQTKEPIRVHWVDANESAPFGGLLLDEDTYKRLRVKLLTCENK